MRFKELPIVERYQQADTSMERIKIAGGAVLCVTLPAVWLSLFAYGLHDHSQNYPEPQSEPAATVPHGVS